MFIFISIINIIIIMYNETLIITFYFSLVVVVDWCLPPLPLKKKKRHKKKTNNKPVKHLLFGNEHEARSPNTCVCLSPLICLRLDIQPYSTHQIYMRRQKCGAVGACINVEATHPSGAGASLYAHNVE